MTTGERIRQLRIEHQMTQEELGARVGVQKAAIYKYENGLAEPDLDTLIRMADFFDTSVDYLIGYSDYERKVQPYTESHLSETELEHMSAYRTLPERMRSIVDNLIEEYNQKQD